MVIFGPYNAFPNEEIEIFYLGECDLSDLLNIYCKLWMTWWKAVDVSYCVVKKLELSSEYFGWYCKNRLNSKQLKMFSWKLKMAYCKLKMYSWKLKTVYWKLMTIANELRSTRPNLVPLLATRCLYQWGIWKLKMIYWNFTYSWQLKMVLKTADNRKWAEVNWT